MSSLINCQLNFPLTRIQRRSIWLIWSIYTERPPLCGPSTWSRTTACIYASILCSPVGFQLNKPNNTYLRTQTHTHTQKNLPVKWEIPYTYAPNIWRYLKAMYNYECYLQYQTSLLTTQTCTHLPIVVFSSFFCCYKSPVHWFGGFITNLDLPTETKTNTTIQKSIIVSSKTKTILKVK